MPSKRRTIAPHFTRRPNPPEIRSADYRLFRGFVREDFRATCAYCLVEELWAAGPENFELDHFRPKSLFPQLATSFYNLYWSCHVCNRAKRNCWPSKQLVQRGVGFVDLCASGFSEHFVELRNGKLKAKTESARYTIDVLRLNRPHLVELRLILRQLR